MPPGPGGPGALLLCSTGCSPAIQSRHRDDMHRDDDTEGHLRHRDDMHRDDDTEGHLRRRGDDDGDDAEGHLHKI
jgi:hypothetical protein